MNIVRTIGVGTESQIKLNEISFHFTQYGIQTVQLLGELTDTIISDFFKNQAKPIAIIKEQTKLVQPTEQIRHLQFVKHISNLEIFLPSGKHEEVSFYVDGYIDLTRKQNHPDIYNWDDIFVVKNIHKTYYELSQLNHKYSARDKSIGYFIKKYIHYEKCVDLIHYPQKYTQCVDFTRDPIDFINSVPEFSNSHAKNLKIANIPIQAANNGFFFRSAENRRQKLYWCPGLNAGIPFVPKPKDAKHELTFMFHDLSHFTIPDLVYTGNHSPLIQRVYIIYRLMSEAFTLVLGDMLFVWTMFESGYTYQTVQARKIYPVFIQMREQLFHAKTTEEAILILLKGSFEYCFHNNTDIWKQYMPDTKETNDILKDFSGKYDAYFMEDFRWTYHNYNDMVEHSGDFKHWWTNIKPIIDYHQIDLCSVEEWIQRFHLDKIFCNSQFLNAMFDSVYQTYIKPLFISVQLKPKDERLANTFIRYMIGQSMVFSRFRTIDLSAEQVFHILNRTLLTDKSNIVDNYSEIRKFYERYLSDLRDKSLICDDDFITYKEIYPIFKPLIVDYENCNMKKLIFEFQMMLI